MPDPALAALAEMLKRRQREIVHPPVEVAATHPALPQFQIPGMNASPQGLPQMPTPNSTQAQPPPANAMPAAPPMAAPPMDGSVPPMPPTQQIGAAPGMAMQAPQLGMLARLLQGSPGVDDWRRQMDMAQFARQGQ